MSTKTITVKCPHLIGTTSSFGPCDGENEVEVTFSVDPGQQGGAFVEYISASVEDVDVPAIRCEWCAHDFTQAERDAIAADFARHTPEPAEPYDA